MKALKLRVGGVIEHEHFDRYEIAKLLQQEGNQILRIRQHCTTWLNTGQMTVLCTKEGGKGPLICITYTHVFCVFAKTVYTIPDITH